MRVVVASYEVFERFVAKRTVAKGQSTVAANVADAAHVCRAPAVAGSIRHHVSNAIPDAVIVWSSHHQDVAGKDAGAHGVAVRYYERAVEQVSHRELATEHG